MATGNDDPAARAAKGAELLDRVRPDWIRIQPAHIQFERVSGDILSLVFGSFTMACHTLKPLLAAGEWLGDYGFVLPADETVWNAYEALDAVWRAELMKRKGGAK